MCSPTHSASPVPPGTPSPAWPNERPWPDPLTRHHPPRMSTPPARAPGRTRESVLQRALLRGVLAVVRRPWTTLIASAVLVALGTGLATSRLTISTDQNKQFSAKVPFFRDYLDFVEKFPENEAAYVVVQSTDPAHPPPVERWTAVADAIAGRVATLTAYVRSVDAKVP